MLVTVYQDTTSLTIKLSTYYAVRTKHNQEVYIYIYAHIYIYIRVYGTPQDLPLYI